LTEIGRRKIGGFVAVCVSRFLAVSGGEGQAGPDAGEVGSEAVVHWSSYYWYSRPNLG
jgi:hypothetical protein